jgi:chromosome segregation ATPase
MEDACLAVTLISTNLEVEKPSALLELLISGFLVLNRANVQQVDSQLSKYKLAKVELSGRVQHWAKENRSLGMEIDKLKDEREKVSCAARSTETELAVCRQELLQTKEKVRRRAKSKAELKSAIKKLEDDVVELRTRLTHKEDIIGELNHDLTVAQTKIDAYRELELRLKETTAARSQLLQEVAELRSELERAKDIANLNLSSAENEKSGKRQVEAKLYELSNQLSQVTLTKHKQEAAARESEKLVHELKSLVKKNNEKVVSLEETNRGLRDEIAELQEQLKVSTKATKHEKKVSGELRQQIARLEGTQEANSTLYQFIHKITEKKALEEATEDE